MRTRTFILSLVIHASVIGPALAVRIFAPTGLPNPPRFLSFMAAGAEAPPDIQPLPAPRRSADAETTPKVQPTDEHRPTAASPSDIPSAASLDGVVPEGLGQFLGVGLAALSASSADPLPPQRVGGRIRPAQRIHHVAPVYPPLARDSHVTGTVILEALIDEHGSVRELKVLRSVPLLDAAAIDAVRQWRFMPTLLNGVPIQIIMSVTVTFVLN
jgi:protein TonB